MGKPRALCLLLLSILVPMGLLTTIRFSDVLNRPREIKRITTESVSLSLTRPAETVEGINKFAQNNWTAEGIFVSVEALVFSYHEDATTGPFFGRDGVIFKVIVNASFTQGFIDSIKISFRPLDEDAVIFLSENQWAICLENATLMAFHYWGANETEAYMEAKVLKSPCSVGDQAYFVFLDEDGSHELQITVEVRYASGTLAEIVTIPIGIEIT